MKYENKFDKVKITIEQLLSIFDNNIIDITIKEKKKDTIVVRTKKKTLPADLLYKYVESFDVDYSTRFSPYKFNSKVELLIYIKEYQERVNV